MLTANFLCPSLLVVTLARSLGERCGPLKTNRQLFIRRSRAHYSSVHLSMRHLFSIRVLLRRIGKAADCKSVAFEHGGSSPSQHTTLVGVWV
jgi:membrane-associated phospholipid phosphatase